MKLTQLALAAATVGVLALGSALPAAAAPLGKIAPADSSHVLLMRHGHGHGHHGGWHRGRGHHYGWYKGRGHHRGWYRGHHRGWR